MVIKGTESISDSEIMTTDLLGGIVGDHSDYVIDSLDPAIVDIGRVYASVGADGAHSAISPCCHSIEAGISGAHHRGCGMLHHNTHPSIGYRLDAAVAVAISHHCGIYAVYHSLERRL